MRRKLVFHISIFSKNINANLVSYDFGLFSKIKLQVKGRRLDNVEEIQVKLRGVLNSFTENGLLNIFQNSAKCWLQWITTQALLRRRQLPPRLKVKFRILIASAGEHLDSTSYVIVTQITIITDVVTLFSGQRKQLKNYSKIIVGYCWKNYISNIKTISEGELNN